MPDGKGYLIPDEPQPEGLRCVRLWVPDDPLYYVALMGAYQFFTTWVAWEKDGTNSASLAASAWKLAYDYTLENGRDCPEETMPPDLTNIENLLSALVTAVTDCCVNNVNALNQIRDQISGVNANLTAQVQLDCIPCEDRPPYSDPYPDPDPDPDNPPVGGSPPGYDSYLCEAIQYVYDVQVNQSIIEIGFQLAITGGLLTVAGLMILLLESGVGAPIAAIVGLVALLAAAYQADEIQEVQNDVVALRETLVCIVYSSSGTTEALQRMEDLFAVYAFESIYSADYLRAVFANAHVLNTIYAGEVQVDPNYDGANIDCQVDCGLPDGYILMVPIQSEIDIVVNNGTALLNYDDLNNEWEHAPLTTETYHEATVTLDIAAMKTRYGVVNASAGICRLVAGVFNNAQDGLNNFIKQNGNNIRFQGEPFGKTWCQWGTAEHAAYPEFAAYVESFDESESYGTDEVTGTWRSQTYNSVDPGTMVYNVWVVGRLA